MSLPDEFTSFQADLGNVADLWQSIDFRIVAVRVSSGWHNVGARLYLDPRPPTHVTRFRTLPGSADLLVIQSVMRASRLPAVLEGVARGRLRVARRTIRFRRMDGGTDSGPYHFGNGFSDVAGGAVRDYPFYSALFAYGYGPTHSDLARAGGVSRERLDAACRVADRPFDGLADLERYFLAKPQPTGVGTMVAFEVFAPFQVRIDREQTRLQNGRLTVRLSARSSKFLEAASVGFFGLDMSDLPVQRTLRIDGNSKRDDGTWESGLDADVGRSIIGKVMLRLGPWCIDRTVLHDLNRPGENQRQRAYQVMDPGEAIFRTWLFPEVPDKDSQFERAVARLLMMLGYLVDSYAGSSQLGEGVDLLAHEPMQPVVLAVECTTGPPDNKGKLGRLIARQRTLSNALPDVEVLPILVTSLPDESIPNDHLVAAARDGVAVVTGDGIQELLRAVTAGVPTDRVTALIAGMVPRTE